MRVQVRAEQHQEIPSKRLLLNCLFIVLGHKSSGDESKLVPDYDGVQGCKWISVHYEISRWESCVTRKDL